MGYEENWKNFSHVSDSATARISVIKRSIKSALRVSRTKEKKGSKWGHLIEMGKLTDDTQDLNSLCTHRSLTSINPDVRDTYITKRGNNKRTL